MSFTITIFAQKLEKFLWKRSKCKIGLIYLVKPLYEIANSNFSRKFTQGFLMYLVRGGSKLAFDIEKPGKVWYVKYIQALKVALFWQVISLTMFIDSKKIFTKNSSKCTRPQNSFSPLDPKMPPRVKNYAFVKVELTYFCCVVWRKIFEHDSVFMCFSTLCVD